ncbi:uncharacterized protein LOC111316341 [Durio zibethinus]|uniref:Uncharacterized protein LOC111316341 n=1 Tax=Durio zibethinus TaxID=66656 RepID=A0A6P6BAD8_DURZI|nr:uncharacterized protein LOC111316341 [Durio zibethinus]
MMGGNSNLLTEDINKIGILEKEGGEEKPAAHSSGERLDFSRDILVVKDDVLKHNLVENPQQYLNYQQLERGSQSGSQEIWEDLIISLLGLNSEYNHLLPTEDENKSDLLTMLRPAIQDESISPHVNQPPSIEDSFHSNAIASPTQQVVLTVLNSESTRNPTTRAALQGLPKWGFLITNLVLETLTAVCDQLQSPRRPHYALVGLLLSLSALLICICELLHKGRKELVSWIWAGRFYHPFPHKVIFSSFAETFGFICAVFQCIFSTVGEKDMETDHAD